MATKNLTLNVRQPASAPLGDEIVWVTVDADEDVSIVVHNAELEFALIARVG